MAGYDQPYTLVGDVAESWNASSSNSVTNPDGSITTTVGNTTTTTPAPTFADQFMGGLLWVFKAAWNFFLTKGIILGVLLLFIEIFVTLFLNLLAAVLKMSDLGEMVSQITFPEPLKYLFYLGAIDYGLPLMIGAYVLKFFIRRLPVVG